MLLAVCGSSTNEDLASLADVKDALDIGDNGYDQTLERFIDRASGRISRFCGRALTVQVYQELLPAFGGVNLRLSHYPVRSILRVFDGSDTGVATELSSTDYRLDKEAGLINRDEGFEWTYQTRAEPAPFPIAGAEYRNWLIEYSAGYVGPFGKESTEDGTTSTGPTLEADIQDACISLVRSMWHSRKREAGVTSRKVGELSVTYSQQTKELPDDVAAILAPYRSVV